MMAQPPNNYIPYPCIPIGGEQFNNNAANMSPGPSSGFNKFGGIITTALNTSPFNMSTPVYAVPYGWVPAQPASASQYMNRLV